VTCYPAENNIGVVIAEINTLCAKLSGAVYCYRSGLWWAVFVGGSVTMITRNCMHWSSPNWVCR